MKEEKTLKVLRVQEKFHQLAKINAAKRGEKIQKYIESLIQADEKGMIDWEKADNNA